MTKNFLAVSLGLSLSVFALSLHATPQNEDVDAKVVVQNAFVLDVNQPLDFGTVRAVSKSTSASTLSIPANPSLQITTVPAGGSDPAVLNVLDSSTAQAAQLSISQATRYTPLSIELPDVSSTPVELTTTGPGSSPTFKLTAFSLYATVGLNANQEIAISANKGTITTDADGNAEFNLGATLSTGDTDGDYIDGEYTGKIKVIVSY